ncbi:hypothetical protein PHIN3_35 [Sinorhizobium phage phiN3]|nr:hypothetical protein AVT40_gp035 [Sinorhizobium phage phiN3]AKF13300.1 hypothetical protein PHIN3_35 [Sinorhizobium phage phiN3]
MGSIMDQERPWERDDWAEVSRKQAQESMKSREKLS